jgi:hypothetical protein
MIANTITDIETNGTPGRISPEERNESTSVCGNTLPAAEVLAELARVVSSPDFAASPRNRRVLQYIVRCALEGRENELTAYHIATRVYDRAPTFDPIKDPIVRIEMAKLRVDLEMYYLKSGARNPLRISIPKGSYVPRVAPAPPGADGKLAGGPHLVAVLRAALCAWSDDREGAVSAWRDLKQADPTWPAELQACAARALEDEKVVRLVVEGALRAGRWADSSKIAECAAG